MLGRVDVIRSKKGREVIVVKVRYVLFERPNGEKGNGCEIVKFINEIFFSLIRLYIAHVHAFPVLSCLRAQIPISSVCLSVYHVQQSMSA